MIKLAVLGDTTTQLLVRQLKKVGLSSKLKLDIWEADFNQIDHQIIDQLSDLYNFNPDVVLVFKSSHKLLGKYNKLTTIEYPQLASLEMRLIENLHSVITNNLKAKFFYFNYTEIDDSVFGNLGSKNESSFIYQLRKLNYDLMVFSEKNKNLYLCDISTIQNVIGRDVFYQPSIYVNSEMVLSLDALPKIAEKTIDLLSAQYGKLHKCLILDLDNTLWGGVIGDDGLENIEIGNLGIGKAFSEFQYWVKKLKNRGVIIAVCSKNTESIAKEPFIKHPDMVLKLDDIAVFMANWNNKADNILEIQRILNIGFDSMVFIDDNPFERNIVRDNIPEICVPEMPKDPADYLEFLYQLNLFETDSYSNLDFKRTELYQIETKRVKAQSKSVNVDTFLEELHMISEIVDFNKFNAPRIAQLSQRSNQFNLRTIRYSVTDIERITASNKHVSFSFSLKDKFGDNGLICVIILFKETDKILFIDTWFMSCRILKRGMENFVLNKLVEYAKENNFQLLKGEYISTLKNKMVKEHYGGLGFDKKENLYFLDIENYKTKKTFIKVKKIKR